MNRVTVTKLALGVVALAIFAFGARHESPALRWVAVALLAVAVAIRFAKPRS